MGITLRQFDQLAGGAVKGYKGSQANRRDNAKNKREQDAEDRTSTEWGQQQDANAHEGGRPPLPSAEQIEAYKITSDESAQLRARIDEKWAATGQVGMPDYSAPAGGPAVAAAATPAAPNIAAPMPPQVAGNVGNVSIGAIPEIPAVGAADGGQVQVGPPDQPVQPPAQALPVQQPPAPPQQAQALPVEQAPEQPEYKTRREEYKAWYKEAERKHAIAGGLEGVKMFRDNENALSRKQMLGYGMEGVAAMRDGNAGEAIRQLNTMLDVSPEDTGMRWEAHDGKVHLVGPDNKRGKAYNQEAVMALIENQIKTPENYLAFQEQSRLRAADAETVRKHGEDEKLARRTQTEDERSALITEGQKNTELTETQRSAEAGELEDMLHNVETETVAATRAEQLVRQVDILEQKLPAYLATAGAEVYSLIKNADTSAARAKILADSAKLGWTDTHRIAINKMIPDMIQNAKLDMGLDWLQTMGTNSGMGLLMQHGAINIMMGNHQGSTSAASAVHLAGLAYAGMAQIDLPANTVLPSIKQENGQWYAMYEGEKVAIPTHIAEAMKITKDRYKDK